jgi:hypothetical protein
MSSYIICIFREILLVKLIQEFRTHSIVPDVRNKRRIFDGNSIRETLLGLCMCRRKKNI